MNAGTCTELLATPAGDLAKLPALALYHLNEEARRELAAHRRLVDHLDRALELRYRGPAQETLAAMGRTHGTVHFRDEPLRVMAELPREVTWDQDRLAVLAERIAAGGEDPAFYLEITYAVDEAKYRTWPEPLRQAFAGARTEQPGQPTFQLAVIAETTHEH